MAVDDSLLLPLPVGWRSEAAAGLCGAVRCAWEAVQAYYGLGRARSAGVAADTGAEAEAAPRVPRVRDQGRQKGVVVGGLALRRVGHDNDDNGPVGVDCVELAGTLPWRLDPSLDRAGQGKLPAGKGRRLTNGQARQPGNAKWTVLSEDLKYHSTNTRIPASSLSRRQTPTFPSSPRPQPPQRIIPPALIIIPDSAGDTRRLVVPTAQSSARCSFIAHCSRGRGPVKLPSRGQDSIPRYGTCTSGTSSKTVSFPGAAGVAVQPDGGRGGRRRQPANGSRRRDCAVPGLYMYLRSPQGACKGSHCCGTLFSRPRCHPAPAVRTPYLTQLHRHDDLGSHLVASMHMSPIFDNDHYHPPVPRVVDSALSSACFKRTHRVIEPPGILRLRPSGDLKLVTSPSCETASAVLITIIIMKGSHEAEFEKAPEPGDDGHFKAALERTCKTREFLSSLKEAIGN
ncbi:hypothetical protein G7046_g4835 [Stylonectria norvegica]|nr:hypothetical protein G7046_g4835 [Stylonectria norvegica]